MVVDRRHQEDALAEGPKREHLDHHRQHFEHEDPAEQKQQHGGVGHDGQPGDGTAEAQRPGVPHEDAGREAVEPQKADARPHQARGEQRQLVLAGGDERDPDVGEQRDRHASRREPVEPVGQVHPAGRTRDHQVDEHRIDRPQVDRPVDEADPDRGRHVRLVGGDPPQPDRDQDRHDQLRPRAQSQRATLRDLRVVIGEPKHRAGDRGCEHPYRLPLEVGQDQERDGERDHDHDPSQGRRPRLRLVTLRSFFPNVLAKFSAPYECDEPGAQEQAHQQ